VLARPVARLAARGEWAEIDRGDPAEGVAAVRVAMRDDIVPIRQRCDHGIAVVAADRTRAPGLHHHDMALARDGFIPGPRHVDAAQARINRSRCAISNGTCRNNRANWATRKSLLLPEPMEMRDEH